MWASYNNIEIPNIVNVFETEETGTTFVFACTFILYGNVKEIRKQLHSVHDKLLAHNAPLVYAMDGQNLRRYIPEENTGFMTRPHIKKLGGWGMKQKYLFMVKGNLPSNRIAWHGAPERYQHGYMKMEANTSLSTSEIETVRFSGTYTATPSTASPDSPAGLSGDPSKNAYQNYVRDGTGAESQAAIYIESMFAASYLNDFDKITSDFYYDDQYKHIEFNIIFRRKNVPNTNWQRYVLLGIACRRNVSQERSPEASFITAGGAFAGKYSNVGGGAKPKFPQILNVTARVAVLRSQVTYSSLLSEYTANIRNFFLTTFKNTFGFGVYKVLAETPEIDPNESTVSSTFTIMTTDTNIWSYTVDYRGRFSAGALSRKILDGKDYSKNILVYGAEKRVGVAVAIETVESYAKLASFTSAFPKPLFTGKNKKGWYLYDIDFGISPRYREVFVAGETYLVMREQMTFFFEYNVATNIARMADVVPNAKYARVLTG